MKHLLTLVGTKFRPGAPAIVAQMRAGCPVYLEREPDNPHDRYAIKVWVKLEGGDDLAHIGYIKGDEAPDIAKKLDRGDLSLMTPATYVITAARWPQIELELE